ncbi:MAG: threonine synthase, partial [Betaproteobacteria bacterium]
MRYVSTRGGMMPQPFTSILIEGLAPDGGLVVPDRYPRLTTQDLARMRHLGYQDLAFEILSRYIDDIA